MYEMEKATFFDIRSHISSINQYLFLRSKIDLLTLEKKSFSDMKNPFYDIKFFFLISSITSKTIFDMKNLSNVIKNSFFK